MTYFRSYSKLSTSLILVLLSAFLSGCSKEWFDEKADKQTTVPDKLADFQNLLDNLLTFQQYPVLGEIASDLHYLQDARYEIFPKGASTDAYIWSKTVRHDKVSTWNRSYAKVLTDNVILEGLEKIDTSNPSVAIEWKNIKGQALFNRARVFFELATTYAAAYDKTTAATSPGVVLRQTSDLTTPNERSTLEKTFERILLDLNEAYKLLPQQVSILTRPSKASTAFLLARVHLYMDSYEETLRNINLVLAQNSTLLDFSKIPSIRTTIGRYNTEVLLHSNFVDGAVTSALVERTYLDQYQPGDLRKTVFYRSTLTTGAISFKGNYEAITTNLFNGFATDEAYLIQAECYARLNKIPEAMQVLNTLLKSRWSKSVPYIDLQADTELEALQLVLTERKKELNFRGVRWMDLKRLNKDPRFAQTITRQVLGQTYTLEPNSYKYSFPIPDDVIEQGGISQNSGWEK
ncbi:RagB/SusD family nutrient uptake outer membrane protein [Chitinophaga sp. GCM10012297]|uniref:RagB/SusD family nutrient uptake outer membrane protein n=1 Tax=Chitinophaga chungangae TaxID=2821488 RepID=A0ABS3YL60_9BACT|nr:RagB/SusD family nutrient uptake outer membrane protein [Chitinophaga chungangae]MBO9154839.1 RagB/SusD family nutrient uptake outer membrane protein [Chitinophaga chungangae]